MNSNSSKRFISHIFQLLLTFAFIGTMFLDNTYYYHSKSYSYYYGYSYNYGGYYSHYNFFESVDNDFPMPVFGVLVLLFTLAIIILTIVSFVTKKYQISLMTFIFTFPLVFNYAAYFAFTAIIDGYLDDGSFYMFIPLGLMIIVSIIGIILSIIDKKSTAIEQNNSNNSFSPVIPNNLSGVKYCTNCGNEVIAQAVICPKCGCQFNN